MRIGFADKDITPENGEDLCGFALRQGGSTCVHDRLKARWACMEDGHERVLIGSADIISLSRHGFGRVVKSIAQKTDVPAPQISLATTHTHSGPATVRLRYCGRKSDAYVAHMEQEIAAGAREAATGEQQAVSLFIGRASCDWVLNRRHRDTNTPVDREVLVFGFQDENSGRWAGSFVNYACHPVVLGHKSNGVSADYPGYLSNYLQEQTGAPSLFFNGAAGDINPINEHSVDPAEARRAGEAIGSAALKALENAVPVDSDALRVLRTPVQIPVKQPTSEKDLTDRLVMLEERFGLPQSMFATRVQRDLNLLKSGRYPKSVGIDLTLVMLGSEAGILFVPGELFCSLGLKIKEMFKPLNLMISGFSNGSVGYLPDRQAYEDSGYEPHFANFFYDFPEFDPAVEDVLLEGARRLRVRAANAVAVS